MNADMLSFREIIIDGLMKDVKEDRKSKKKVALSSIFLRFREDVNENCKKGGLENLFFYP
jgi:hypothetical protein